MHYKFCPQCGAKLHDKLAGDDGPTPYCDNCTQYWFDVFPSCVIILVANELNELALLRQGYLSDKYCSFVAGYMTPGENAEECALREVYEELGIHLDSLEYGGTYWFGAKGILMHGFIGRVKKCEFKLSQEVDSAKWVSAEKASDMLFPDAPGNAAFGLYRKFMKQLSEISEA